MCDMQFSVLLVKKNIQIMDQDINDFRVRMSFP